MYNEHVQSVLKTQIESTNRGSVERNLCYVTRETHRENESMASL